MNIWAGILMSLGVVIIGIIIIWGLDHRDDTMTNIKSLNCEELYENIETHLDKRIEDMRELAISQWIAKDCWKQ